MEENNQQKNNPGPEKNLGSSMKPIHTYTSDMADAIRMNEASVIKIALAEKQSREETETYKKESGSPASKILLIMGGIILVSAAIIASYYVLKQKSNQAPILPEQVVTAAKPIISSDETVAIDATKVQNQSDLYDAITKEMAKPSDPGSIKEIVLAQTVSGQTSAMPVLDLLSLMKVAAPAPLLRTLDSAYMIGIYTSSQSKSPDKNSTPHLFLILSVKDYNLAYKSMLDWEPTLLHDMYELFKIDVSGDQSALLERPWKDITINNNDARILYDTFGNDILYYIFPNKTNLIITDSADAIREINARILTKNTKPI